MKWTGPAKLMPSRRGTAEQLCRPQPADRQTGLCRGLCGLLGRTHMCEANIMFLNQYCDSLGSAALLDSPVRFGPDFSRRDSLGSAALLDYACHIL